MLVAGTLAVLQERGLTGDRRAGLLLSGLTTSVWRAPTDFLLDVHETLRPAIASHNIRSIADRWPLDSNQLLVKLQYAFRF